MPPTFEALSALPGMGAYTAGAVASIAFGIPVPAVDGNVTRVIARLFRIREDVSKGATRGRIAELAVRLVSLEAPGQLNQALMELGATICTPASPACDRCPLEAQCLARAAGEERKIPKAASRKPVRIVQVALTGGGGLIDLRFQVIDPNKADAINAEATPPTRLRRARSYIALEPWVRASSVAAPTVGRNSSSTRIAPPTTTARRSGSSIAT